MYKNKTIPKDTPDYLRKALERAIREYEQGIEKEKSSLKEFANKYIIKPKQNYEDPLDFFREISSYLKEFLRNHRNIKIRYNLACIMEMLDSIDGGIKTITVSTKAFFNSRTFINLESTDVKKILSVSINEMLEKMEEFIMMGSGWYLKEILYLEMHTVDYKPMRGGEYIPLPDWIMRKKAIVSLRNKGNKCFISSILRYLYPKEKNDNRIGDLKQYENDLVTKGLHFPLAIKNITKFEDLNPDIPGINVFSVNENKKFYPLRMANKDPQKTTDLFLYQPAGGFRGDAIPPHYSLIENFSRLFRSQITTRTSEPIHNCKRCFTDFTKKELLAKHIQYCSSKDLSVVKMPPRNTFIRFKNYDKQLPIPFVIYADFECFTKPMSSCSPNPEDSFTYNYQKHEPSGFCFYIKGIIPDKKFEPITYTKKKPDDDIALIFVRKLEKITKSFFQDFFIRPRGLNRSYKQYQEYLKATICHICKEEIPEGEKVCDHCHFTGQYRGPAHRLCNLKCRKPMVIPVIFHNLQGYDAHLFVKKISTIKGDFTCIPSTEEKYISFSKKVNVGAYQDKKGKVISLNMELRFIDSFKFLQTSLANLVAKLQPDDFINIKAVFTDNTNLLTKKGIFPYDYVSCLSKFDETCLPPRGEFYSKLNDEDITEDEYQHATNVWNAFKCKNIRDYHNLYLKSDVLLLADVFENFRATCLKHYNLDPAHYYTSPGLAWDACLKETDQELQLLHDYNMLMMFEKGIRGGISHISKRYAEANNKYMQDYDPDKPSSYIQYLDANNLYGWAMSQALPTKDFKWMKNLSVQNVINILDKHRNPLVKTGYIFEVDLEYPKELWKQHNDYPLAPEKVKVDGVEKLICHFKPRKNYVVNYVNLRQYLEMGMILTAVHKGISFNQSPWMEPYIRKNTELRKCAANSFEKDFFKLMNNSVFGETIENIRKRQNIQLIDDRDYALKLSSRPTFERATIFDENLIAVHMKKTEIYFNKPIYVGQAILDLSKTLMFDFHYNYIQRKYSHKKASLLFTDTDSLMYQIQTDDFYSDISDDIEEKFDTSDYPPDHASGILTGVNKKSNWNV